MTPLDLTDVPAEQHAAALTHAFEALPAAGELLLITAASPRALLKGLIAEHWGRFDWAPLRIGDAPWQTSVRKRASPGPSCLSEFMEADHQRCDALFVQAEEAAAGGDAEHWPQLFAQLAVGLRRHFEMEEEGFFREFETRMGMVGSGPTAVMREEHAQLRGLLSEMEDAARSTDAEAYLNVCETMLILMEQHNMKEEQVLYAMADDVLGDGMEDLLKQLLLY